jgi:hypothetical protein
LYNCPFGQWLTLPQNKKVSYGVYFYRQTKSAFYAGFSVMKSRRQDCEKSQK